MPCRHRVRRRFQTSFRRMDHCIFWRLGFRQSSCSPYRAGPSARRPIRLDPTTDFLPCCCPQYFLSDQGQALGPGTSLQVPPHCVGDTTGRFVAHHALVPFTFRIQVSHQAHEPPSCLSPAAGGYNEAPRGAQWSSRNVNKCFPRWPIRGPRSASPVQISFSRRPRNRPNMAALRARAARATRSARASAAGSSPGRPPSGRAGSGGPAPPNGTGSPFFTPQRARTPPAGFAAGTGAAKTGPARRTRPLCSSGSSGPASSG